MRQLTSYLYATVLIATSFNPSVKAGLVESKNATNRALLVGVPDDLSGIEKDLEIVSRLLERPDYSFHIKKLWAREGTAENIVKNLDSLSTEIKDEGTLFFYYSGHGVDNEIEAHGGNLKIKTISDTIAASRAKLGPLARLVVFFDACRAGTFIDPFQKLTFKIFKNLPSQLLAKELEKNLENSAVLNKDWKNVFVFASSQADEDSQPTEEGSQFTVALKKAFEELAPTNGKLSEWADKTILYTEDHRPVPHFYPASLANERLF